MKKRRIFCIALVSAVLAAGCAETNQTTKETEIKKNASENNEACMTPFGRYDQTITYTLGNTTGSNRSNMPKGDTYEDNAYTRYLKKVINVQNQDVFEGENGSSYEEMAAIAISSNSIPDIMLVTKEQLDELVSKQMIQPLDEAYENCASDKIKEMYDSYGSQIWSGCTYDGKIMALPSTNIDGGPSLLWLRKDWMDKLHLEEPETISDVYDIISAFTQKDPGNNGKGKTVGLLCDSNLTGTECGFGSQFQTDIIFAASGAFPKNWIKNSEGEVVYGSVQPEVKSALKTLRQWYDAGVLDKDFLLRTTNNNIDLVEEGRSGSFFGLWWSPNNPLMNAMVNNPKAEWVPYLIETDENGTVRCAATNPTDGKYIVVRKGYKHPEVVAKILSVLFDSERYNTAGDFKTDEIEAYYRNNVDPTARPLSVNVDYRDAVTRCYKNLSDTLSGKRKEEDLNVLEMSYYESCRNYLDKGIDETAEDWAAYMSRVKSFEVIENGNVEQVESLFFGTTDTMEVKWWKLKSMEKQAYLEIITGEKPLEYFDEFVASWKQEGGDAITEEVRVQLSEK